MGCENYGRGSYKFECPVCKQESCGGVMSTDFGHSVMTCSSKCGKRYMLWLRQGKVTEVSDFELSDPDIVNVNIHTESHFDNWPFEVTELRQSNIELRTQIKLLKRRLKLAERK